MHLRSSPHPAHASADIDAHALSSSPRGSAGRNTRPTCHVEQAEKAIWDKARPRCIEMAIALGTLAVREETLWYHQMQIVLGAGHSYIKEAALLLDLRRGASGEVRRDASRRVIGPRI